jgi:antitoxin (DNA-binding transcriptional repressor) of toxin-antitoxin stability system
MKQASVRDLRYHFSRVEHLLREGDEIQITKRKRVVARLLPVLPQMALLHHRPDFLVRLKKTFGSLMLDVSGADLLAEERGRY